MRMAAARPPGNVFDVTAGCTWPARPPGKVFVVTVGCAWPARPPGKVFDVTVGCDAQGTEALKFGAHV